MSLPARIRSTLDLMDAEPCICATDFKAIGRALADMLRRELPDIADSDIGAVVAVVASEIAVQAEGPGIPHRTAVEVLVDVAHALGDTACDLTRMERTT